MTLREVLTDVTGIDDDPLGCAFVIAALLRTAVQGEPSTYEGECASLVEASKHFDVTTGDGIRAWLADLGRLPDVEIPDSFWLSITEADRDEDESDDDLSELTDADRKAVDSLPADFAGRVLAGYRFQLNPDGTFSHWEPPADGGVT